VEVWKKGRVTKKTKNKQYVGFFFFFFFSFPPFLNKIHFRGKVHGSLARAGKVRGQTPKVDKAEKKKKQVGRAKKRQQ
jgi:hypothetical protein